MPDTPPRHAAAPSAASVPETRTRNSDHWRNLVGQVGSEVATPLGEALELVHALVSSGRIDRSGLRRLRESIETARRQALIGQQIARLGGRSLRLAPESLDLQRTVESLLSYRRRDYESRGIAIEQRLRPVAVATDGALLFSLINALLDWIAATSPTRIEISVESRAPGGQARLQLRSQSAASTDWPDSENDGRNRSSLTWELVQALAKALSLPLDHVDGPAGHLLSVDFPNAPLGGAEPDDGFAPSANSRPLEGTQVLVVVSRRELRVEIREAIRHMGLMLDFVHTLAEAEDFCQDTLPHAVIYEAALDGTRFGLLRDSLLAEVPSLAFVEITEGRDDFEPSGHAGAAVARVGRALLPSSLPSALLFEMSRGL